MDYCSTLSKKIKCQSSMQLSAMMVKMSPCEAFDDLQKENCQCVPKEKAQDAREQAIATFYDKYAGDIENKQEKIMMLMAKTTTTGKMASLYSGLVEKYPSAIEQVPDEHAIMMQNLMKGEL
mmetsp:Transcript_24048/g.54689  ORF Transcript_24048/g.54689 Transcript_24048/m.54689 type:complete len:122 (-) Transcript_24048:123-488(-)